jgi:hypothetical protein
LTLSSLVRLAKIALTTGQVPMTDSTYSTSLAHSVC